MPCNSPEPRGPTFQPDAGQQGVGSDPHLAMSAGMPTKKRVCSLPSPAEVAQKWMGSSCYKYLAVDFVQSLLNMFAETALRWLEYQEPQVNRVFVNKLQLARWLSGKTVILCNIAV